MKMNVSEIGKAVSAQNNIAIESNDINITSVSFDSRKLKPGALFIPLVGNNDGHKYINSAIQNGAVATLWGKDHPNPPTTIPTLLVDDPLSALQRLSRYYLNRVNPKVVAVTGSNGKTTTKDMIASVLATTLKVTKTYQNYNNEIGVPITILSMDSDTKALVVEMGMDRPGQLDKLSRLATPDISVVTMIGEAHIEYFGSRDKIADAKMEIVNGLKQSGMLIYNGDEPLLNKRANDLKTTLTKTFGQNKANDIYPEDIEEKSRQIAFTPSIDLNQRINLPMIGSYNVNNALAAIQVGRQFKITSENTRRGLERVQLTENRTEWFKGNKNEQILSDVYNSNPTAAKSVLNAFAEIPTNGKRIIVLGDMLELGSQSMTMHKSLNKYITPDKFSKVYLIGKDIKALYHSLTDKYNQNNLKYYLPDSLDNLFNDLQENIQSDDLVMLKASHGIHLEDTLSKMIY